MTKHLSEYYRLPEPWVEFSCSDAPSQTRGFFSFGANAVGHGTCSSMSPAAKYGQPLRDAHADARVRKNLVQLPFIFDEVVDSLRLEHYTKTQVPGMAKRLVRDAYYYIRPYLSVSVRRYLQRLYLSGWKAIQFPRWPVDRSVDSIMEQTLALGIQASGADSVPFIWFWPDGFNSACIVTHDVETAAGRDFCSKLMDMDDSCGFRSSFQVVPEQRYEVPVSYLEGIRARGFEVNVHDLDHDGMLFLDEKTFMKRVEAINRYGKQFGSRGFRSGIMYRNQDWFHALEFEFDMSVPNVAHLEPQRGGCCTVMPYFIGNLLELPLTTAQDYSMFYILGERSIHLWKQQIDVVHRNHGLITILTHPDYLTEPWAQELYLQLLRHLGERASRDRIWRATPGEVNDWWRIRSRLSLTRKHGDWQIEGDGSERARLAFASLEGESVRYSLAGPAAVSPIQRVRAVQ